MENTIITILKELINKDKIDTAYNDKASTIDFNNIDKLEPNMKVIIDFNDVYFNNFEYTLLFNSIVYALEVNDQIFLNYFKNNISNIKNTIKNNSLFKIKITEYAIKNINNKIDNNMNYINDLNNETINNNSKIFDTIKKQYFSFKGIGDIYRSLIIDLIYKYPNIIKDDILFFEQFLFSKKYDSFFIVNNKDFINENNISQYKIILTRLILADNYINTEVELIENDFDDFLNDIDDDYENIEEEELIEEDTEINNYLNECIKHNYYYLPKDNDLRFNMYRKFLIYNSGDYDKSYDYDTINSDNEKRLKLIKINPLSKIDLLNIK